jgi:isopentenyl phosphate kinase
MQLILLKLGGSLITEKDKPYTARFDIISSIVSQISKYNKEHFDTHLIIGNGGGSFPHRSAALYGTVDGFRDETSPYGSCRVHTDALELHFLLIKECIKKNLPVYSLQPSALFMTADKKPLYTSFAPVEETLKSSIIPFVYGDVILDTKIGATIYSTEEILSMIAMHYKEKKMYDSITIIHAGKFDGVYDTNGTVIPTITSKNFQEIKRNITHSENIDVTGGMLKKVTESLRLTEKGIDSYIINGEKENNIYNALKRHFEICTYITNT